MTILIEEKGGEKRLEIVEKFLLNYHIDPISINDHKGCLEITWKKKPENYERGFAEIIWKDLGECYVEHTYPKTITEMVKL